MKNLQIPPLECTYSGPFRLTIFDEKEVRELERQRNEMLEALTGFIVEGEESDPEFFRLSFKKEIALIEKAIGCTWDELQEGEP